MTDSDDVQYQKHKKTIVFDMISALILQSNMYLFTRSIKSGIKLKILEKNHDDDTFL